MFSTVVHVLIVVQQLAQKERPASGQEDSWNSQLAMIARNTFTTNHQTACSSYIHGCLLTFCHHLTAIPVRPYYTTPQHVSLLRHSYDVFHTVQIDQIRILERTLDGGKVLEPRKGEGYTPALTWRPTTLQR